MKSFTQVGVDVLQVLLLAQVCFSTPRPDPNCLRFQRMSFTVVQLQKLSKDLLRVMTAELGLVDVYRLEHLPAMEFSRDYLYSLTLNESLSELYRDLSLFKLHVDWLDSAREGVGLPALLGEGPSARPQSRASAHLAELAGMSSDALQLLKQEVPPPPSPSLPAVPHTFDVLHYSIEMAERLERYSDWSRRVLKRVIELSRCT